MKRQHSLRLVLIALTLVCMIQSSAQGQVIEERKGEANPGPVIFRSTAYGAATGLVLGGAYALVEDDEDLETGEILKWGVASGAAAGALIGLIYVIARPEPKGDVEGVGTSRFRAENPRFLAPGLRLVRQRDATGGKHRKLEIRLVRLAF